MKGVTVKKLTKKRGEITNEEIDYEHCDNCWDKKPQYYLGDFSISNEGKI